MKKGLLNVLFMLGCYLLSSSVFVHASVMSSIHLVDTHDMVQICGCSAGGHTDGPVDHNCFEMCMDPYTVYASVSHAIDGPSFTHILPRSFDAGLLSKNIGIHDIHVLYNQTDPPLIDGYAQQYYIGIMKLIE